MDKDAQNIIAKSLKIIGQLVEDIPSEQALLAEYQACQAHNNALSTEFWAVTGIMTSISAALLGGSLYTVISNSNSITISTEAIIPILGLGMVVILGAVVIWLKRIQIIERVHHHRMREIEESLPMEKNWLVHGLDLINNKKTEEIPNRMKQKVSGLNNLFLSPQLWNPKNFFYRYEHPKGSQVVFSVFVLLVLFWVLFVLSMWLYVWLSLLAFFFLVLGAGCFIRPASKGFSSTTTPNNP